MVVRLFTPVITRFTGGLLAERDGFGRGGLGRPGMFKSCSDPMGFAGVGHCHWGSSIRGGCHAERGGVNASAGVVETVKPPARAAVASRATPPVFLNLFTIFSIRSARLHPPHTTWLQVLKQYHCGCLPNPIECVCCMCGITEVVVVGGLSLNQGYKLSENSSILARRVAATVSSLTGAIFHASRPTSTWPRPVIAVAECR